MLLDMVRFIAGYPCTGKTTFGNWLRDHRGYLHIDLESDDFRSSSLHAVWERALALRDMAPFVSEALRLHPRVVITWGFPPQLAWVAASFRAAGVRLSWFDADPDACRAAWSKRGTGSTQDLERQLNALATHRADAIAPFVGGIVSVLPRSGQPLDFLQIADAISVPDPRE